MPHLVHAWDDAHSVTITYRNRNTMLWKVICWLAFVYNVAISMCKFFTVIVRRRVNRVVCLFNTDI